ADEVFRHNEQGTGHVVALARRLQAVCFNHVSTAYVCGRYAGRIPAALYADDAHSNSVDESSKIVAERLAHSSGLDCVRFLRPSVVIGHSVTYGAPSSLGLYGFVRIAMAWAKLSRRSGATVPEDLRIH